MTTHIDIDADLNFSAATYRPPEGEQAPFDTEGFNKYGVRTNYDDEGEVESVDVVFRAMEPGVRKDIRVTRDFLAGVADSFSDPIPMQLGISEGHDTTQRANVGTVQYAWTTDALYLMGNVPNTGNSVRADAVADFTHEPPAITDGSVGFGRDYEIAYNETSEEYVFERASLREFSLTPFPAGYDRVSGGLSPAFCAAAADAGLPFDDAPDGAENKVGVSRMRRSRARISEHDF